LINDEIQEKWGKAVLIRFFIKTWIKTIQKPFICQPKLWSPYQFLLVSLFCLAFSFRLLSQDKMLLYVIRNVRLVINNAVFTVRKMIITNARTAIEFRKAVLIHVESWALGQVFSLVILLIEFQIYNLFHLYRIFIKKIFPKGRKCLNRNYVKSFSYFEEKSP